MGWKISALRAAPALTIISILVIGGAAAAYLSMRQSGDIPAGFAMANGRIEVERVDVATKYAGRVATIRVNEGDDVAAGGVVAQMDVTELNAQLAFARASARQARQGIVMAEAELKIREAEHKLSEQELFRIAELERRNAATKADLDRRAAQHAVAEGNILGAKAAIDNARAATEAAEAQVNQLEVQVAEMTLRAPVAGRVEYKLVQPGTVIGGGARVATLLDLSDVYMTVFLPTNEAGLLALGSEARIVIDAAPSVVIPATVTYVAGEAQFTPKTVETANEREKLMYRVKLRIDPALLQTYRSYVKAGLTGEAYLKTDATVAWPERLQATVSDGT
jgi:HlyD family secretion protein